MARLVTRFPLSGVARITLLQQGGAYVSESIPRLINGDDIGWRSAQRAVCEKLSKILRCLISSAQPYYSFPRSSGVAGERKMIRCSDIPAANVPGST
jgi:hypothetical protein